MYRVSAALTRGRASLVSQSRRFQSTFICSSCRAAHNKWIGKCTSCNEWNTIIDAPAPAAPKSANSKASSKLKQIRSNATKAAAAFSSATPSWLNAGGGGGGAHGGDEHDSGPEPLLHPSGGDSAASVAAAAAAASTHARIRLTLGSREVDRVFGGGIVPGSLTLLAGDPGIGKSTLVMQLCKWLADSTGAAASRPASLSTASASASGSSQADSASTSTSFNAPTSAGGSSDGRCVLYVSGEETAHQLRMRAERLGVGAPNLLLWNETDIDRILERAASLSAAALVIDSVQTVQCADIGGGGIGGGGGGGASASPGAIAQLRESTARCLRAAKALHLPIILVGHVTKAGEIAGPRVIEHMVDCVLYLEGDRYTSCRMLRVIKNRFGSNAELAVLDMGARGMEEVANPSALFLSTADGTMRASGCAVTAALEGSRPLLCEVQAIATPAASSSPAAFGGGAGGFGGGGSGGAFFMPPKHRQNGIDADRFHLLLAVLGKRANLPISRSDLFVNVVGGMRLREPAADLAVCAAIASAVRDVPWPPEMAFLGEVGLAGELRAVPQLELRLREVAKLGFRRCFVPFISSAALNYSSRSASGSGSGKVSGAPSSPPLVVSGTAVPGSRFSASLPDSLAIVPCMTLAEVLAYLPNAASSSYGAPNARGGSARRSGGFAKPASTTSSSASSSSMSPSPASSLSPFDESAHEYVLESDLNAIDDGNRADSIESKVL